MNAAFVVPADLLDQIQCLEEAISRNREEKKGAPDCPCWANAPQMLDAELYQALDEEVVEAAAAKIARLKSAVRRHREQKALTPECTCWVTPSAKADAKLYSILEEA